MSTGDFSMSDRHQQPDPDPLTNRLLATLPETEYSQLRAHLDCVHLNSGTTIYAPDDVPEYVYFPLTGCASVVVSMADGAMVEAGTRRRGGPGGRAPSLRPA